MKLANENFRIPEGDIPGFVLLGSDELAVPTIEFWIKSYLEKGGNRENIQDVVKHLESFKKWEKKKLPDAVKKRKGDFTVRILECPDWSYPRQWIAEILDSKKVEFRGKIVVSIIPNRVILEKGIILECYGAFKQDEVYEKHNLPFLLCNNVL